MKINLVENGIFPIVIKNGKQIDSLPDTGTYLPGTIQGEGKLTGTPCLFVRTSGCNLRCIWKNVNNEGNPCDTPYSSHKPEKYFMEVDEIISIIKENSFNGIKHVVVSGGEPTIQTIPLIELLTELKNEFYHTTLETNATIFHPDIAKYTDLISMSPKLSSSNPTMEKFKGQQIRGLNLDYSAKWEWKHDSIRINIDVIQKYISSAISNDKDFQLKFVVSCMDDIFEIKEIIDSLEYVKPSDVLLMPEGVTPEQLMERSKIIFDACLVNGWRFSTRLHTILFHHTLRGV